MEGEDGDRLALALDQTRRACGGGAERGCGEGGRSPALGRRLAAPFGSSGASARRRERVTPSGCTRHQRDRPSASSMRVCSPSRDRSTVATRPPAGRVQDASRTRPAAGASTVAAGSTPGEVGHAQAHQRRQRGGVEDVGRPRAGRHVRHQPGHPLLRDEERHRQPVRQPEGWRVEPHGRLLTPRRVKGRRSRVEARHRAHGRQRHVQRRPPPPHLGARSGRRGQPRSAEIRQRLDRPRSESLWGMPRSAEVRRGPPRSASTRSMWGMPPPARASTRTK